MLFAALYFCLFLKSLHAQAHDFCNESEDPGPCQDFQIKWYWDKLESKCKEFYYGGCLGNQNRFDTKYQCVKRCKYKLNHSEIIPDLCFLPPDKGECKNYRTGDRYYYFNAEVGKCEPFLYRGCGGNSNRFYSLQRCRNVCAEKMSPHKIACSKCDLRISSCKEYSKYNFTCECIKGYQKSTEGKCIDINECNESSRACDQNAQCFNTPGSYKCRCNPGYRGNGNRCSYVGIGRSTLDCKLCNKHATCTHGVCTCKEGFSGDGFNCTDVDECHRKPGTCDKNANCRNNEGSYTCECLPGFAGNGYFCTKENDACLDDFDVGYQNQCGIEEWREHYYFDHQTKKCKLFWYDGCPGKSRNIFSKLHACELLCEFGHVLDRAETCWDKFEPKFAEQCRDGKNWEQRFYFDHHSMTCKMFWYDGCVLTSNNVFNDLLQCQWLCEEPVPYKSKTCLEPFDERYRGDCNGVWTKKYYFDKYSKKCEAFWYSGCTGTSQNMYPDERTCLEVCGLPPDHQELQYYPKTMTESTRVRDRQARRTVAPTSLVEVTEKIRRKIFNLCEYDNPCANGGKCRFDLNQNKSYCECTSDFRGENCTEKAQFDPCASNPCQNGATCLINANNKTAFQCFCTKGYGGDVCNKKPCDPNPCFNRGACTPTTGYPWFICKCDQNYSGKLCEDEKFMNGTETTKYGPQVKQISSGEQNWINEMKKREEEKQKREQEKLKVTTAAYDAETETGKSRREGKTEKQLIANQSPRKGGRKAWRSRDAVVSAPNPSLPVVATHTQQKKLGQRVVVNVLFVFIAFSIILSDFF